MHILNILLVEDSDAISSLITDLLDYQYQDDFNIKSVFTLKDALVELRMQSFDIALLDLLLLDNRGIGTLISIEKLYPRLPIIVISSSSDKDMNIKTAELGAQNYIPKSQVTGPILASAIDTAIIRQRKVNENSDKLKVALQRFNESNSNLERCAINLTARLTGKLHDVGQGA